MDRLGSWLTARPVAGFALLTFGISYLVGGPVLLVGMATMGHHPELLHTYAPRIVVVYGPGLAALLLARLAYAGGPAVLLHRLIPTRKDAGVAAGILLVVATSVVIALRTSGFGWDELSRSFRTNGGLIFAHLVLQLTVVALGEELGWRGWLLPHLARRMNRLRAALWTGAIWAAWHAPMLVTDPSAAIVFLVFVLALSVIFTWLWSLSHTGLFTVIVAHASVNAPWFFWEQASAGIQGSAEHLQRAWWVFQIMFVAAALVLLATRRRWWATREDDIETVRHPNGPLPHPESTPG